MVPKRSRILGLPAAIAIVAALLLAMPAAASASDTYADASRPDNSEDCLTPATACQTIGGVDGALSKSGPGDTTFVADGTYAGSLTLTDGKSLVSLDATDPKPIIDNGTDTSPAITVDGVGAGTISGFTIRSDFQPMDLNGPVTVEDNVFDDTNESSSNAHLVVNGGESIVIQDNLFQSTTGDQIGVRLSTTNTPASVVSDNAFSGLSAGVLVVVGEPLISANQVSGVHPGSFPFGDLPGSGVAVLGGTPTITENTMTNASSSDSAGIYINPLQTPPGPFPTGAELSRNRITQLGVGVQVIDSDQAVTLDNDLIYDNDTGLIAADSSGDVPPSTNGDVSATNVTIFDNDTDVGLSFTTLTLDSSIVGDPIDLVGGNGACSITYSRGSSTAVANGCDDFVTTADPEFEPVGGEYRLTSTSPLIDAGNPDDPGGGAVDFYGGPRAVEGKPCSTVRRDIGADEFDPPFSLGCEDTVFADQIAGSNSNDCLTPATACQAIAAALFKTAPDATVFVSDGSYAESLTLDRGISLLSLDSSARPVIDNGAGPGAAIEVESGGAGTISGFRIRSDCEPLHIKGEVTVEDNVFDEDEVPCSASQINLEAGGSVVITDNQFEDPNASGQQYGIQVSSSDTPEPVISDNTFTDLAGGILGAGEMEVTGNQFLDTRVIGVTGIPGIGALPGAGVVVLAGTPTIAGNTFGPVAQHPAVGVFVESVDPMFAAGATLSSNRIFGNDTGVEVIDSNAPVTLSNDLIYDNTVGLESTDTSADNPTPSAQGDVSATNVTIFGNAVDLQLSYTTSTLNSTILGAPIDFVGNAACSISYSRGSPAPSANGCGNFASTADPQFVNAAAGDFHLQSSSPLIDVADPASPGGGAVDFYGGPRAVQGKACSTVRRDIGAAEYDPGTTPACPSPPPEPAPSPDPAPRTPKIDERPEKRSKDRSPTFEFSSNMPGVTFRCRLDRRVWKACTPPVTYRSLSYRKHRFRVQAISPSGKRSKKNVFTFRIVRPE